MHSITLDVAIPLPTHSSPLHMPSSPFNALELCERAIHQDPSPSHKNSYSQLRINVPPTSHFDSSSFDDPTRTETPKTQATCRQRSPAVPRHNTPRQTSTSIGTVPANL
ncbi:hypothetical protein CC2G_011975 [Coprinopsis cinerea AmutBmut pab1-1]|nr:hypothetical protein CC2G_011975 [Coprinopsis cinerea AmutBmut pab1-1]